MWGTTPGLAAVQRTRAHVSQGRRQGAVARLRRRPREPARARAERAAGVAARQVAAAAQVGEGTMGEIARVREERGEAVAERRVAAGVRVGEVTVAAGGTLAASALGAAGAETVTPVVAGAVGVAAPPGSPMEARPRYTAYVGMFDTCITYTPAFTKCMVFMSMCMLTVRVVLHICKDAQMVVS
jgi:hypothetical protein